MKYKLSEIAQICGGRFVGKDRNVNTVMTDSRHSFGRGEHPLFAAMVGVNYDGHSFVEGLYKRGVRGFVVEKPLNYERYPEAGFVVVRRTFRALQALAEHHRSQFKGRVVAVTGSQGKTVVKEWIAQAAPEPLKVFRSPRSYNSQLGVALSLLMMKGDEDLAVIEAGISKPGEMEFLTKMIHPDVGVFTMLAEEHGENFSDMAQKAAEKAKLFVECPVVIYNSEYPHVAEAICRANATVRLVNVADRAKDVTCFKEPVARNNAAMVAAVYEVLGYDRAEIERCFGELQPVDLQLELREGIGNSIVVGDNHNTDINSLSIALDYLANVADNRSKVLILSDIVFSSLPDAELYRLAATTINVAGIDRLIGVGERIKEHGDVFECESEFYNSVGEFIESFTQDKVENCAVLVKGNQMAHFDRIVHLLQRKSHTTILEINLDALAHNLAFFRSRMAPDTKLMAMVKASAYGNGDYEIANMLTNKGVDYLAVAFADEGVSLRRKGITIPIVVLNADSDSFDLMVANHLEPEIYNFTSLEQFVKAVDNGGQTEYPIHIKIDSGMHRLGFEERDVARLNEVLKRESQSVVVRSIFSHMATADMPEEREYALHQVEVFDKVSGMIMAELPYKPLRHINNSAGIVTLPKADYDMCRLGIGLYGCGFPEVREISRLKTAVVQVRELEAGESVGYGRAGRLERRSTIATVPIGYADGLNRHLGCGRWSMMVNGKTAPIVGRICMDSCMIDVTGLDVVEGDIVTVFGGGKGNSVEDMAKVLDTISYEIMTSVSQRVKRIFIKE